MKQLCQRNDCTTYATYNFPGMSKRRFCGRHALTGMVNVKQKPKPNLGPRQSQSSLENACIYGTCQDTAVYGWRDNPTKVFCIAHTLPGMVVDAEPLDPGQDCLYDGCSNTASCSYKGPKSSLRPRFCDMHKRPGMSLTKTHFDQPMTKQETSCIYGECHELAAFNFRTLPARFCGLHISDGMVGATDSSADTTTHEQDKMAPDKVQQPKLGAKTQNSDNASENSKPQIQEKRSPKSNNALACAFCLEHQSEDMVDVRKLPLCHQSPCPRFATCNFSGAAKVRFCAQHAQEGMVDIQLERELKSGLCAAVECVGWGSYGDAALAGARVGAKRLQAAKKFCSLNESRHGAVAFPCQGCPADLLDAWLQPPPTLQLARGEAENSMRSPPSKGHGGCGEPCR